MIHFITALPVEAKPIIRLYNLKQRTLHGFRLFENRDIRLIVSGTGKIASAVATTILMSQYPDHNESVLAQIGFAGSADRYQPTGSLWIIHSVTDHATGRSVYPDMIWNHPFGESALTTVDRVLTGKDNHHFKTGLYDMEAYGFFHAGIRFVKTHQLYIFKIVSDHLDFNGSLNDDLRAGLEKHGESVARFIEKIHQEMAPEKNAGSACRDEEMRQIRDKLRLTETQFHQLRYALKAYGIRHGKEFIFTDITSGHSPLTAAERDRKLAELFHAINQ